MQFVLTCCRQMIDDGYFQEFEHLIRKELTQITPLTDDFDALKKEADKISDLNQRELFYVEFLTHRSQNENKGNLVKQIVDEINLIQRTKELDITEKDTTDTASIKVRAAVMLELLKEMKSGVAHNDRSKICKLIAFMTGNSYNNIYNELQKGIHFSNHHHGKQINEANKILKELNTSISININKNY